MTPELAFAELSFTAGRLADAVGWALVHSLWQGALVAALYACFAAAASRAGANVRYAGGVLALALLLLLPLLTVCVSAGSPRGLFAPGASASEGTWADTAGAGAGAPREGKAPAARATAEPAGGTVGARASDARAWAEERLTGMLPWLVFLWLAGVALSGSRLAGAWLLVLRLRRGARPVPERFEEMLGRVRARLRVTRAVRLCQSALVEAPTVVGHLRPVILVPASALLGLTPQQLEAVLAHELAHVRRCDFAVNLLQAAAETLLFYHPAAWWLGARVRAEREHACDDAAVAATGDVLLYARALAALEHLRGAHAPAAALALSANGGSLMRRIQRLVNAERRARKAPRRPAAFAALVALLLLGGALAAQRSQATAGQSAAAAKGSAAATVAARREVAVTFVNFPGNIYDSGRLANKTRKLLRSLASESIEAVAFVNESRLYREDGSANEPRMQTLRDWLDAGHELGNETFTHKNLSKSTLAEFRADVVQGEQVSARLLSERGRRLRYFSYPYLHTGATPEAKAAAEKYLRQRGYKIHPVTVDTMDWLFTQAYIEALRREDEAGAAAIRAEYVPYMERMFDFYEQYSRDVLGREVPQVLMLTAGALNADAFDDLAAMMKRRGYRFVTMEQATRDEAYSLPDDALRRDSWIARWAVSKGMEYRDSEEVNLPEPLRQYYATLQKRWAAQAAEKK